MKTLVTDQGTATIETGLCTTCYPDAKNQAYAREMASRTDDINPDSNFIDCSQNEDINCCICGKYKMTVTDALQLIIKNKHLPALNYCINYAEYARSLLSYNGITTRDLRVQILYIVNSMIHWRQCKASTTTAAEIKECRAVLKKASV